MIWSSERLIMLKWIHDPIKIRVNDYVISTRVVEGWAWLEMKPSHITKIVTMRITTRTCIIYTLKSNSVWQKYPHFSFLSLLSNLHLQMDKCTWLATWPNIRIIKQWHTYQEISKLINTVHDALINKSYTWYCNFGNRSTLGNFHMNNDACQWSHAYIHDIWLHASYWTSFREANSTV